MYGVLSITGCAAAALAACNGLTGIGDYPICSGAECDAGGAGSDAGDDGAVNGAPDGGGDGSAPPSRGLVCSADQWCFEMPLPAGAYFTTAAASSLDEYYVAGRGGILVRRKAGVWSQNLLPQIRDEYRSLYLADSKTLWAAVGKSTIKINLDTLTFENVPASPADGTPLSIHGDGAPDMWMLATNGVFKLDVANGRWVRETTLSATDGQVFARTRQDVWVAANAFLLGGRLLRRIGGGGGTWVDVGGADSGAPTGDSFASVYSDDAEKVWVGGFRLQRKTDAGWSEPVPSSLQLFHQMGGGQVQAYGARGSDGVFVLNGNSTASALTGSNDGHWTSIGFTQPRAAVAAGDTVLATIADQSFKRVDQGAAPEALDACWAASPQTMFAVGEGKVVYTRTEAAGAFSWSERVVVGNPSKLLSVSGVSATDAWVVGAKYAAHFNGSDWAQAGLPAVGKLTGVAATPSGAWIVGEGGTVLRCVTASNPLACEVHAPFAAVGPDAAALDLRAVWAASDTEVWVVGDKGFVARFDGATWSTQAAAVPSSCDLATIHGNATQILMAGNNCGQFVSRASRAASRLDFTGSGAVSCTGAYVVDDAAGYIACSGVLGVPVVLRAERGALKVTPEIIATSGAPRGMCGSGKRVWATAGASVGKRGVVAVKDLP